MSALIWLEPGDPFPDTRLALDAPDGLLAAGADLRPGTLLSAYARGIFPWYSSGQPILWWSPDPRLVVEPARFHVSRSLARTFRRDRFRFSLDHDFQGVIQACATTPRRGQGGTWLTQEMVAAYQTLHELGYAHSVETWQDGRLVGGMYGIQLGGIFFGESMFSHATDASKCAFALLCALHEALGIELVDCQVESSHLLSLGARTISRRRFEARLQTLVHTQSGPAWQHPPASLVSWQQRYRLAL